ncbi:MAG: hypothetical protein J5642_04125 [Bacteroidales bacterium]|nr:hypothetical protein [Bacteroidales bacterium]
MVDHIGLWALLILLLGWIWYGIGFAHSMEGSVGFVVCALMSSLEMFVSHSDLIGIEIKPAGNLFLEQNAWYLPVFFLLHFLALFVSAVFLINLFGNRLYSRLSMRYYRWFSHPKTLYIFYGIHENTLLMAENFKKELDRTQKGKYQMVFIETHNVPFHIPQRFSFLRILIGSMDHTTGINHADELDAWRVLEQVHPLGKAFFDGLLAKCVKKSTQTHLFLFSNQEEENIHMLTIVNQAEQLCRSSENLLNVYCMAQRDAKNLAWEASRDANIHIVDDAMLAVSQLMENRASLPANFVRPDTTRAVATAPFRAVIIGFGPIGQSMLHFLYEHSAFLDTDGNRNEINITVLDEEMDHVKPLFFAKYPALKDNASITLLQQEMGSPEFLHTVEEKLSNANYFVVALNNDKFNLSAAADLADWLILHRSDFAECRIFVPVYSPIGYQQAAELAAQKDSLIIPFGEKVLAFTHANIVKDTVLQKSKHFFAAYQRYIGEKETWEERARRLKGSTALNNQRLLVQQQDQANAYHITSKMILTGINSTHDTRFQELLGAIRQRQNALLASMQRNPNGKPDTGIGYSTDSNGVILENLAACEHLRWMASAELLGYTDFPENEWENVNKKDFLKKRLNCLKDWKTMSLFPALDETKALDRSVVDVSFLLMAEDEQ